MQFFAIDSHSKKIWNTAKSHIFSFIRRQIRRQTNRNLRKKSYIIRVCIFYVMNLSTSLQT